MTLKMGCPTFAPIPREVNRGRARGRKQIRGVKRGESNFGESVDAITKSARVRSRGVQSPSGAFGLVLRETEVPVSIVLLAIVQARFDGADCQKTFEVPHVGRGKGINHTGIQLIATLKG